MANVTATTGWVWSHNADPSGDLTIDSGSNRKLVLIWARENNTDPNPTSMTVGGSSADEFLKYEVSVIGQPLQWHYWWIWDESTIGGMSGTTVSLTATTAAFGRAWGYGVIEDTNQAALSSLTDTVYDNDANASINITTTSDSGDLITVTGIIDSASEAFTSWDTLTEIVDTSANGCIVGFAAGDGGDNTTTVVITSASDTSLSSLVFPDFTGGGIAPLAMYHLRYH